MNTKLKRTLQIFALIATVIGLAIATTTLTHNKLCTNNGMTDYNYQIYRSRTELAMEGVRDGIVTEIENYIDSIAPDSGLNPIRLFELCDKVAYAFLDFLHSARCVALEYVRKSVRHFS